MDHLVYKIKYCNKYVGVAYTIFIFIFYSELYFYKEDIFIEKEKKNNNNFVLNTSK